MGVRTGNQLRFYNIGNNFKYIPELDFTLPSGADELITYNKAFLSALGVRTGNQLRFYSIGEKFKYISEGDFTLPSGTDELIIVASWMGLGVRIGNELKFYDFREKNHNPKYDFQLP